MNIATNPWSFISTDVASSTAAASPTGMVQQGTTPGGPGLGAVLYTATGAHGLSAGQYTTYIGDSNGRFLGWYKVINVPSATTALLANLSSPTSGFPFATVLAASGGGTMLVNQVQQQVRAEDISIQITTAAGVASAEVIILDRNGNLIWQATVGTGATASGLAFSQNRGKIMWVDGVTLQAVPASTAILVTIN
jgi:hypothetical protein